MIKDFLQNDFEIDKFHNSYLISTDDLVRAKSELDNFLASNVFNIVCVEESQDYIHIQRQETTQKNIAVDQVRSMQNFLYKTSVISGKKVAVISEADLMNVNAANCCLKVLEDTPENTHIFLLTNCASSILPTIRSRCSKIDAYFNLKTSNKIDLEYIKPALKNYPVEEKFKFFDKFASRDRVLWSEFSDSVILVLAKLCKKLSGVNVSLSEEEHELLEQMKEKDQSYLLQKYDKVKALIDDTNKFDLELKNSVILITDFLRR